MCVQTEVEQGLGLSHFALRQLRHFVNDRLHQVRGVADGGEADQARAALQGVHGALQFFHHFFFAEVVFKQLAGGLQQLLCFVGEDVHQDRIDVVVEIGDDRHFFYRRLYHRRLGCALFGFARFLQLRQTRRFGRFGDFRIRQGLVEVAVDVVEDVGVGLRQVAVAHRIEHEHALPHRADEQAGRLAARLGLAIDDAVNQRFHAMRQIADGVVTRHACTAFQRVHVAADGIETAQLTAVFVPALGFFLTVGKERHRLINEGFRQHGVGVRVFHQFAAQRIAAVGHRPRRAARFAAAQFAAAVHQRVDDFDSVVFVRFFFVVFNQVGALAQHGGAAKADRRAFLFVGEQQLLDGVQQTPDPRRCRIAVDAVFDVVHGINQVINQLRRFGFVGKLRQGIELIHRAQEAGAVVFDGFFRMDGIIQPRMLRQ